jgi:hypothetical protein
MALRGQPDPIKYKFDADAKDFSRAAQRVERDLKDVSKQADRTDRALDLDVDVDDSALGILRRRLIAARADLERDIEVNVDLDATTALRRLNTLDRQIKQVDRQINIDANLDRDQLATSMDEALTAAQPAAEQSGGLLGLALAVGIGQALKGAFTGILSTSLKSGFEDAAGTSGALFDELERMRFYELDDLFPSDFGRKNKEWAEYESNARKISVAREKLADDDLSALFDREAKAGFRAAGGVSRAASGMATLGTASAAAGPPIIAAGIALAGLAAAAVGPGVVGGGIAGALSVAGLNLLDGYDKIDKANNKARIVFGDNLQLMQDWAEGLSANVGLGEKEIVAQSSAIQDLLVPQGFKRKDAAELTQSIYERGAALAEFSGLDTAQGVEAVNNALLGQRKQLKGLGVDISAKEVTEKAALLKAEKGYEGYNDKMLASVATLALIEEKSGDAWTAFTENTSAADAALDTLNSTLANLKTDAIEGFGGILAGIIRDFGGLNAEAFDLAEWIDQNSEKIRSFFLDLATLIADGALSALDLARAITTAIIDTAPMVADFTRVMGQLAANAQITAGAFLLLNPLTMGMGRDLIAASGSTRDLADSFASAYENGIAAFGPDVLSGIDAARGGVEGFKQRVEDLKALDAIRLEMVASLKDGSVDEVKAELATLSKDELATIIANIDPESATKAEKRLLKLAKKRLALIEASPRGADAAARALDLAAKDRTTTIYAKYKFAGGFQIDSPSRPSSGGRSMSIPSLNRSAFASGGEVTSYGPGGTVRALAPSPKQMQAVNVYLDSRKIASYMQPAGSATEPRTRRP